MSVRIVPARAGKGFEYDIRFRWPEGGRLRERGKCPLAGKDAARRWAEARERAIALGGKSAYYKTTASVVASTQVPTLAKFWPRVVRDHYQAERKKASTVAAAESIYRLHLAPALGAKRLDRISTASVQALKGALSGQKPKTVNNVLSVLSRALRCAVDWEVIAAKPCRFGLLKVTTQEMEWYEREVYRRLVEAAEKTDPTALLLVLLAGSAGLRRGEIIALRWCDVDLERRHLRVDRAIWQAIEDTPKGGRGRIVPLTPELVVALREHRMRTGLRERVLYSRKDRELSNREIRHFMIRAQHRARVEAKGAIHVLRHTFCSHLAIAGVPATSIRDLAGHVDLATTTRYMHLSPSNQRDAMRVLSNYYKQEEGKSIAV